MPAIAALICGFIFGWGLLISGMMQPAKVLAFLDIFGNWDPSLAVVMAAALAVSSPLVIGAVLFGTGWGLSGLCPGPALENLATLSPRLVVFVIAMAAGMVLHDAWQKWRPTMRREHALAATDG
jgi:uncharacterized protein